MSWCCRRNTETEDEFVQFVKALKESLNSAKETEQPAEEQPAHEQPAEEQPAEEQPAEEQPTESPPPVSETDSESLENQLDIKRIQPTQHQTFLYIRVFNSAGEVDFTDPTISEDYRLDAIVAVEQFVTQVIKQYKNMYALASFDTTSKYGILDFLKKNKDRNGIVTYDNVEVPALIQQLFIGHMFTLPLNEEKVFNCTFYTSIPPA
jgi:hypothetical protein